MKNLIAWGIRKSKDSVTHLYANCAIAVSGAVEVFSWIDADVQNQIVGTIAVDDAKWAARVGLVLMIGTKMARDRRWVPFTSSEPHSDDEPPEEKR